MKDSKADTLEPETQSVFVSILAVRGDKPDSLRDTKSKKKSNKILCSRTYQRLSYMNMHCSPQRESL